MAVTRQRFNVLTDATSHDFTDSGPAFNGIVTQIHWEVGASAPSSSSNVKLTLEPSGLVVFDGNGTDIDASADFQGSPRSVVRDTGGAVNTSFKEYIYSAGDHLKLYFSDTGAGAGGDSGTLTVWTVE